MTYCCCWRHLRGCLDCPCWRVLAGTASVAPPPASLPGCTATQPQAGSYCVLPNTVCHPHPPLHARRTTKTQPKQSSPRAPPLAHPLLLAPVLPRPRVFLLLLLLAAGFTFLASLPCCLTLPPLLVVAVLLEAALPKLCCLGRAVVHKVEGVLLLGV